MTTVAAFPAVDHEFLASATRTELKNKYEELFGMSADSSLRKQELHDVLVAKWVKALEAAAKAQARRDEVAARKAECEARAAGRGGSISAFLEMDWSDLVEGEKKVYLLADKLQREIRDFEAARAKFAENMATDPVYAMSWSNSLFSSTAAWKVAQEVCAMIEAGADWDAITRECTRQALRTSAHASSSTSPTSNLLDQRLNQAWAKVAYDMTSY